MKKRVIYLAVPRSADTAVVERIKKALDKFEKWEVETYIPGTEFDANVPRNADMLIVLPPKFPNPDSEIWVGRGLHSIIYSYCEKNVVDGNLLGLIETEDKDNGLASKDNRVFPPLIIRDIETFDEDDVIRVDIMAAMIRKGTDWKDKYAVVGTGGWNNFSAVQHCTLDTWVDEMELAISLHHDHEKGDI